MALSKLTYNSLNVTAAASKAVGFDSGADGLEASLSGGSMVFIKKLTASSSATLSFVNGTSDVVLDSTYKEYLFILNNIHPETDNKKMTWNMSADTGSNYNVTKTTACAPRAIHSEGGADGQVGENAAEDLAQGTGFLPLHPNLGNGNDECSSGYIHLFNPSSTTFVKHFMSTVQSTQRTNYSSIIRAAGYFNTTSAIDAVQFKISSGNIDAGDICLYGIST
jgi:hypothetical protein